MTRHILGLALAATLTAACDSTQPPIGCPVQSLDWAATYKPLGSSTCPLKAGEQLGIEKYSPPSGDEQFSINPQTLVDLNTRDTTHLSYSLGQLAKASDTEGFCAVSNLTVAEKHAPAETSGPDAPQPAADIVYQWSDVRILATAEAPGTQLVANLTYTENGCTAQYEVWAMWPGDVDCKNDAGEADDSLCASAASINPDFASTCDPTQFHCVPAKRPPSLK